LHFPLATQTSCTKNKVRCTTGFSQQGTNFQTKTITVIQGTGIAAVIPYHKLLLLFEINLFACIYHEGED
jgi:hypothetical protein